MIDVIGIYIRVPEFEDDVEVSMDMALPPVGSVPVVDEDEEILPTGFLEPKRKSSSSSPNKPPPLPPVEDFLLALTLLLLLLLAVDAVGTVTCPISFIAEAVSGTTAGATIGTAAGAVGNPFSSPTTDVDEDTTADAVGVATGIDVVVGATTTAAVVVIVVVDSPEVLSVTNAFLLGALRVFPCCCPLPPLSALPALPPPLLLDTIEARSSKALLAGSR